MRGLQMRSTTFLPLAVALALTGAALPAAAQTSYPFDGSWAGGPANCSDPFRFDGHSYTPPGGDPMRMARIRKEGRSWRLEMLDGYAIVVTPKGRTMLWESGSSGDMFELTRCPNR
jgi:hypothetical protein